jgi:hypothetical protein
MSVVNAIIVIIGVLLLAWLAKVVDEKEDYED